MGIKPLFSCDVYDKSIVLDGKRFSDFGMMWSELCEKTGMDLEILQSYDDWYVLEDNFYYFKNKYIFEELFMSELAYECGVKCVSFKTALMNDTLGIISKLYRTNDKKYYMYSDFCDRYFGYRPNNIFTFQRACSIALGEEKVNLLMNDIFSLIGFDMLSGQWDREEHNFFFECGEDGVRLAPICDNGVIFSSSFIYNSPFEMLSLSSLDDGEVYHINLQRILCLDKLFFDKLAFLLDIDMNEILERTFDKYRMSISDLDKSYVLSYFDNRKKAIDNTLRLVRK